MRKHKPPVIEESISRVIQEWQPTDERWMTCPEAYLREYVAGEFLTIFRTTHPDKKFRLVKQIFRQEVVDDEPARQLLF